MFKRMRRTRVSACRDGPGRVRSGGRLRLDRRCRTACSAALSRPRWLRRPGRDVQRSRPRPQPSAGRGRLRPGRNGVVASRGALPERRHRSPGVRLQRVHAVRVRQVRRRAAARSPRSVSRGETGEGRRARGGRSALLHHRRAGPTHVGIAIGGDQFVHAPSSTGVVRVERLSASYWSSRYLGARRIDVVRLRRPASP